MAKAKAQKESEAKAENAAADIDAGARAMHDTWVQVELSRTGVLQSNPLLCIWDMLPEDDKERYREIVARGA